MAKKTKGIIQAYTDGAYDDYVRKTGGYGAVIYMGKRLKKFSSTHAYVDTTHNRMEIRAILAVLMKIETGYTIDIYSDSTYCVNMLNRFKSEPYHEPKKNRDLWSKVSKQIRRHKGNGSKLMFTWVRGHSGNQFNEMADSLAQQGAMKEKKMVCDQSKTASNG
jgi:ribonuclease HI